MRRSPSRSINFLIATAIDWPRGNPTGILTNSRPNLSSFCKSSRPTSKFSGIDSNLGQSKVVKVSDCCSYNLLFATGKKAGGSRPKIDIKSGWL